MDYAYIDQQGWLIEIVTNPTEQQLNLTSSKLVCRGVVAIEEAPVGFIKPRWSFKNNEWYEYVPPVTESDQQRAIKEVHTLAWEYVYTFADEGGLLQITDWKHSLDTGHEVQPLITAIETWKDAVMAEYLLYKKPQIQAGNLSVDMSYDFIGAAPVTFTDVFLTVNAQFRPDGWIVPDVSSYTPGTR